MPKRLAMLTSLALLSTPTIAGQLINAEKLLQLCQQDTQAGFCQGYIAGAADADNICVPADVALSTLTDLAVSSIKKADTPADTSAAKLVNARLAEVFPCDDDTEKQPSSHGRNWSNKERIGK
jgi:hypothetical protein